MNIWRHLYDPSTDTHYTNGGYLDESAATPVDGWQWLEGYAPEGSAAYEPESKQDIAKRLVNDLPALMRAKYYSHVVLIRDAINNDDWEVVPHLLGAITTETQEEADAFAQIQQVLTQ